MWGKVGEGQMKAVVFAVLVCGIVGGALLVNTGQGILERGLLKYRYGRLVTNLAYALMFTSSMALAILGALEIIRVWWWAG